MIEAFAPKIVFGKNGAQGLWGKPPNGGYYDFFYRIDRCNGQLYQARFREDYVTAFPELKVRDTWLYGCQPYCAISNQLASDVLDAINGVRPPIPEAIKRMQNDPTLQPLLIRYFPLFANNSYTVWDTAFTEVGNCNPSNKVPVSLLNLTLVETCNKFPMIQPYIVTEQGRGQMERYRYDANIDIMAIIIALNEYWNQFCREFRRLNYCSPYATDD